MNPQKLIAYIEVEVKDRAGNRIFHKKQEANSLVRGWIDLVYTHMSQIAYDSVRTTDNTLNTFSPTASSLAVQAGIGTADYGIIVGTGTNAVALEDYKLQTQIVQGSGAGQLLHLVDVFPVPVTSGSTRSFTITRDFTNSSGANITVKEVGLATYGNGTKRVLIDRTLMTFTIVNGATGTVTYTIQASV